MILCVFGLICHEGRALRMFILIFDESGALSCTDTAEQVVYIVWTLPLTGDTTPKFLWRSLHVYMWSCVFGQGNDESRLTGHGVTTYGPCRSRIPLEGRDKCDSNAIIQLVLSDKVGGEGTFSIMAEIRKLLSEDRFTKFTHTYREGNRCADWLANWSCVQELGYKEWMNMPHGIGNLLLSDALGVSTPRFVLM